MRSSSRCMSPRVSASRAPNGSSSSSTPGMGDERAREGDALALAAREHGRPVVRAVGEPDVVERRRRGLAPAVVAGDADVADHPLPGKQPGVLKQQPDARLQRLDRSGRRRRSCPRSRGRGPRSAAGASTCRSRNGRRSRRTAPAGIGEIDVREHAPVAEGLGQAIDDDRLRLRPSLRCGRVRDVGPLAAQRPRNRRPEPCRAGWRRSRSSCRPFGCLIGRVPGERPAPRARA